MAVTVFERGYGPPLGMMMNLRLKPIVSMVSISQGVTRGDTELLLCPVTHPNLSFEMRILSPQRRLVFLRDGEDH